MKEWQRQREECFSSNMTHRASIHLSSVLNSSKVGNIFWKAKEHFAQMKLHPLALNTDPQTQSSRLRCGPGAQPPAKLPWSPADLPRESTPRPQLGFEAAARQRPSKASGRLTHHVPHISGPRACHTPGVQSAGLIRLAQLTGDWDRSLMIPSL